MKYILNVSLFCTILIRELIAAPQTISERPFYQSRYDHIDIHTIIGSKRLVQNYADCLLDKKPCTPEGKDLKKVLPEALETACKYCTSKQKFSSILVINRVKKQYPALWSELLARYDPTGEKIARFEEIVGANIDAEPETEPPVVPSSSDSNEVTVPPLGNRFGPGEADSNSINGQNGQMGPVLKPVGAPVIPTKPTFQDVFSSLAPTIKIKTDIIDRIGSTFIDTVGRIADMVITTVDTVVGSVRMKRDNFRNRFWS